MAPQKSIAFHTLGCKLNYSETASISRMMEDEGFEKKAFTDDADIYVINTCSVTDNADKECRLLVRRIQRRSPQSVVVITGCYAQLKPKEIAAIPGVDLVLGAAEKFQLPQHLRDFSKGDSARICSCDVEDLHGFNPSFSIDERTRAFLKVQDGCDYNCSFCTIPMARGRSRSNTTTHAVANARALAERGVQEIVLTGINLGDFGKSAAGMQQESFYDLIQALENVEGISRYRISSIEPNLLSDRIIDFVAGSEKFMPHFHIPLQSGSNRILKLMRRRYLRELYGEKVARIKSLMPHCAIGADVIVGFPGETEEDFEETQQFLHDVDISYLHTFTYSERAHTKALDIQPVVPMGLRYERNKKLRNLSFMKMQYFTLQQNGLTRKVLFESEGRNGMMEGYSDNYIKITTPYRSEWRNRIVDWPM